MHRPNILLFIPHDLGDYLGCYRHRDVKTPNLDALAEEGVRFENYFAAAPECTPSRAGMMTGLYTHQNGLMGLCHRGWEFFPHTTHLAERMRRAGYRTMLFGLQHETAGDPRRLGYQSTHSPDRCDAPSVCDSLNEFLSSEDARMGPWFAQAGFSHVHRPWPERTGFAPADVELPAYLPDIDTVRADYARFYENIRELDESIGTSLRSLDRAGLTEETLVVFTTDHGSPFPRAKSTYYDPGIRIPLIMRHPRIAAEGRVIPALVSNIDFTPTLLDLVHADTSGPFEGRSFSSLLTGGECREREAVYGALYYDAFYDPMHCVRTKRYKYIRSFAVAPEESKGADPEVLAEHRTGCWIRADDTDVQSSDTWRELEKESWAPPPPEELYDLHVDPLEMRNLLVERPNDPAVREAAENMRTLLSRMMERTRSPLLRGHVSPALSSTRNRRIGG